MRTVPTSTGHSRLQEIEARIRDLQTLMAIAGPTEPSIELVAEHRDLVRERNSIRGKTCQRA